METSNGNEQDKIAPWVIPYTRGKCLDLGCGTRKAWPGLIGVDNGKVYGPQTQCDIRSEIDDLSMFTDASMDGVFSSHALEDFAAEKIPSVLREWSRVLKKDGFLTLYVPSANLYPKIGEPGANPYHKVDIFPGDVEKWLQESTTCGWTQLEREERNESNEYSHFLVFQKRDDGKWVENIWERNPEGKKRALVIRYGAIGDLIVMSSILPLLKEQGYHITINTMPESADLLFHDPHVDAWLLQDRDQVPNLQLGPYWDTIRLRYDKVVNLCESVEGALLTLPGRLQHTYPEEARRSLFNVNYLERTHDIAGVPHKFSPRFYATDEEIAWAEHIKRTMGSPLIYWAINGSASHKVYPWIQVVVKWLLEKSPCAIALGADAGIGKQLQDGILEVLKSDGNDMSRVHGMAGVWSVRKALAICKVANCIVGPETGPLNAVCMERVPKVIYLSHSTHENLTKHWVNTHVLMPDKEFAPCWPCHRLHYDWSYCNQDKTTNAALCASSIKPTTIFEAIAVAMGAKKAA
jgi:ADP-heptose:LPS heptosyltransferase